MWIFSLSTRFNSIIVSYHQLPAFFTTSFLPSPLTPLLFCFFFFLLSPCWISSRTRILRPHSSYVPPPLSSADTLAMRGGHIPVTSPFSSLFSLVSFPVFLFFSPASKPTFAIPYFFISVLFCSHVRLSLPAVLQIAHTGYLPQPKRSFFLSARPPPPSAFDGIV